MRVGLPMMRPGVLVLASVLLVVAAWACALAGCYRCDGPGYPRCPDVQPDYPAHARDAGPE